MTCYFRHLDDILSKSGIRVTNDNKREIDKIIHSIVGVDYKNCPAVWREVKKRLVNDQEGFISELRDAWGKRR